MGEECAGFSYDNVTGTGVFKTNVRCGVTASAVYDGYAKADHIVYDERGIVAVVAPAAPDDGPATTAGCDAGVVWEHASGGYREACGGDFGNLESFQSLSLEEARDACCVSPSRRPRDTKSATMGFLLSKGFPSSHPRARLSGPSRRVPAFPSTTRRVVACSRRTRPAASQPPPCTTDTLSSRVAPSALAAARATRPPSVAHRAPLAKWLPHRDQESVCVEA